MLVSGFKFAPDDVDFHVFEPKSDLHGLGYAGLDPAAISKMQATAKEVALKITQKQKKGIQGQVKKFVQFVGYLQSSIIFRHLVLEHSKKTTKMSTAVKIWPNMILLLADPFHPGLMTIKVRRFFFVIYCKNHDFWSFCRSWWRFRPIEKFIAAENILSSAENFSWLCSAIALQRKGAKK